MKRPKSVIQAAEQLEIPELRKLARMRDVEAGETVSVGPGETLFKFMPSSHYYDPCKYCGSADCKIAPLKPGMVDPAYAFPWTRRSAPAETARIELTECEQKEWDDSKKRRGIAVPEKKEKRERVPEEEKPELSAVEVAEKVVAALRPDKARSVERLCSVAGIEVSDKVTEVLKLLKKRGMVVSVMGGAKWRLA